MPELQILRGGSYENYSLTLDAPIFGHSDFRWAPPTGALTTSFTLRVRPVLLDLPAITMRRKVMMVGPRLVLS